MESKKMTRNEAIELLKRKAAELCAGGEARFPKRSDFSEREVVAIKAFLGPWPRALETAGLKPLRDDGYAERKKEKRIQAKRRRTVQKIQEKKASADSVPERGSLGTPD